MATPPLPKGLSETLINEVANRLHSAAIHLLRSARVADTETGLSPERLSLLSLLVYAGPTSLGRLAEAEQVSRPAISRTVKALVEAELVRTERGSSDRRRVIAHATATGRRLMEAGRRRRIERIAERLSDLDDEDLETLRRAGRILEQETQTPADGPTPGR